MSINEKIIGCKYFSIKRNIALYNAIKLQVYIYLFSEFKLIKTNKKRYLQIKNLQINVKYTLFCKLHFAKSNKFITFVMKILYSGIILQNP